MRQFGCKISKFVEPWALGFALMALGANIAMGQEDGNPPAIESTRIILQDSPIEIDQDAERFYFPDQSRILGSSSFLCVVIAQVSDSHDSEARRVIHDAFLDGLKLHASAFVSSGRQLNLSDPAYSWSLSGRILEGSEISSCLHLVESREVIGDDVEYVDIQASRRITVLGLYWESTNAYDDL